MGDENEKDAKKRKVLKEELQKEKLKDFGDKWDTNAPPPPSPTTPRNPDGTPSN